MSLRLSSILNAWSRRASVALVLLGLAAGATLATGTASANVQFNLTGVWDTYGTGGGYSGTFTMTTMDTATGDFSGTGDGTTFVLKGTELGTTVQFTQSEGGYVATDSATLDLNNGVLEMVRSPGCSPASRTAAAHAAAYSPSPAATRSQVATTSPTSAPRSAAGQARIVARARAGAAGSVTSSAASGTSSRDRERAQQRGGVRPGAHPREDLERGKRAEDLRLGPVVDVVA